jgi:hypothetical protein
MGRPKGSKNKSEPKVGTDVLGEHKPIYGKDCIKGVTLTLDTKRKMLAQKKLAVMGAVSHIEKTGKNSHFQYDYVEDVVVTERYRTSMLDCGIAFGAEALEVNACGQGAGKIGTVYSVKMKFTLTDVDTGYSESSEWFGMGADSGDKALYKAYVGAKKYFLTQTFLAPTGNDPECDGNTVKGAGDASGKANRSSEKPVRRTSTSSTPKPASTEPDAKATAVIHKIMDALVGDVPQGRIVDPKKLIAYILDWKGKLPTKEASVPKVVAKIIDNGDLETVTSENDFMEGLE